MVWTIKHYFIFTDILRIIFPNFVSDDLPSIKDIHCNLLLVQQKEVNCENFRFLKVLAFIKNK